MNTLRIQQGNNIEVVTTNIIKKLYDVALSIPTPLEGETDPVYLSGNLLVDKTYATYVEYLTGRFPDLHINVTGAYYVIFEDPEVERILKTNISSDGVGVSTTDCENVTSFTTLGLSGNTSILTFDELKYFTNIKSLPQGCLTGTSNITKINLRNIESIGLGVFDSKTSLNDVVSSSNLKTIGLYAFKNTTSLLLMDMSGVTTISNEAFRAAGLQDVNCPSLQTINGGAFSTSNVRTVTNLGSITTLPEASFWNCSSLTSVTLPTTLTTLGKKVFKNCTTLSSVTGLTNITTISNECFLDCRSLTSITLPPSLTSIGNQAFYGCTNLTTVTGLSDITTLGNRVFYGCTALSGALDLSSLTSMDYECFYDATGITSITSLGSLTRISSGCFLGCKFTTIPVLSNITRVDENAFAWCNNLSGVTQQKFPNLTNIGQRCFEKSSVTGHWDLTNITNIGNRAFYGSAVTEITISDALLSDLRTILGYFGACRDVTKINANYRITSVNPVFPAMSSLLPFVLYLPLTTLLSGHIFSSEWTDTYNTSSGSKSSCPHWTHLYYPNLTTTVYSYCYFNNNGDNVSTFTASGSGTDIDLIYVKNVLTLDKHTFPKSNRIEAFVINNTTVPKIISHERNGLTTQTEVYAFSGWDGNENGYSFPASSSNAARYHMIYVPDSAVQDYKTAWPIQADHIYSIHDLNNGVYYETEADWETAGEPIGLIGEYLGLNASDLASFVTANNLTKWTNPNA